MKIKAAEPIDPLNVQNTNAMMKEWQREKDKKFFDLEAKVKEFFIFLLKIMAQ